MPLDKLKDYLLKHFEQALVLLILLSVAAIFDIIAAHHENFDGSGYPAGLKGEDILIGGRILAVADSYDAMTSWRPWQERWEHRSAFADMKKAARKGKYDPKILDVLGNLLGI